MDLKRVNYLEKTTCANCTAQTRVRKYGMLFSAMKTVRTGKMVGIQVIRMVCIAPASRRRAARVLQKKSKLIIK
jgi:hypothetical protein